MFGSMRKKVDDAVTANEIETVIGKNTRIQGEISGSGNVRVDGRIDGSISIEGNAVIGEPGIVNGNIKAANLIISGSVRGNANIDGSLCIHSTGQLEGDVKVKSLNIEDGGAFQGRSEMALRVLHDMAEPPKAPEQRAPSEGENPGEKRLFGAKSVKDADRHGKQQPSSKTAQAT